MSLKWVGLPDRCKHGLYVDDGCKDCEIERLRSERDKMRGLLDTAVDAFESGKKITVGILLCDELQPGMRLGAVQPDWLAKAKEVQGE